MWVLGLTGGIGSGKTAASDFLASLGVTVVDADVVAREIVFPHQPAWQAILEHFGEEVLLENGELNRAWLRAKVFAEPQERLWLEQQTHPRIRTSIIQQLNDADSAYALLVSPLLFESKQAELTQRTLLVDVPEAIQLERACQRDANNTEQIRRIMAAQMARDERLKRADDIVDNSSNLDQLHAQLKPLHQRYLQLAGH